MGTYSIEELIQRWFKQDLLPEQVIGQMLQLLRELVQRVEDLESRNRYDGVSVTPKRR